VYQLRIVCVSINSSSVFNQLAMHIHADGTYKVIWQGHTLLVAGTTDQVCLLSNCIVFNIVFRMLYDII